MTIIYLKDFVLSGQFGKVKIGMDKDEVIKLLGQPDDELDYDTGSCGLLYGWYEFFYFSDNKTISGIQNDNLTTRPHLKLPAKIMHQHRKNICYENDCFKIDTWFLRPGHDITRKEVKIILSEEGINFVEIKDSWGNDILRFESGITMDFSDNTGNFVSLDPGRGVIENLDDQLLEGIRCFKMIE